MTLEADGKELLQAKARPITDEMTHLFGMECLVSEINERSLIVGSLDDAGRGVSYWRHLKLRQPKESVLLKDFWVDVKLTPPSE